MGKWKSVMGVHKHSMLKHCLQVCTRPLMGMREVELEFVAMLNLARKEEIIFFLQMRQRVLRNPFCCLNYRST